ncbi:PASTA domain-containing protein [Actinocorallia libanotica]|uniref:PASTA domain-containing protein n=1 Tax=Actinocorallia libanotica TaxID=46162 RepID=A0ABN1R6Q3_9ACTN
MGAHGRKRPINAKAAGAVAVVAVAGLAVGLMGSDGDSDETAARETALVVVPSSASAAPQQGTTQPHISSKPVSAAPRPTTVSATPTEPSPAPSKTRPATTPTSPPAPASPPAAPAPPPAPATPAVPHVVGMSVNEAAAALAAAGYGHQVVCQEGPATGRVASQLPAGGQQWNPGGQVALFVTSWRCRGERPDRPWNDD